MARTQHDPRLRIPIPSPESRVPVKYAIVTFGCRVNQADSLRIEEELRARGGVGRAVGRRRPRRRQHLLGDRDAPTRARDRRSAASRATIPRAQVVVTGCYATPLRERTSPRCPTSSRVVANDDKDTARRRIRMRRDRCRRRCGSATATARAARRSSRASPAGRRSRCACRPAARSGAPTASSRRRAGAAAQPAGRRRRARGRARRRGRLQGDRADRRAPRIVRPRPRRRASLAASSCCARSTRCAGRRRCSASARSSRWTARRRSSISSPRAAAASRRTSTCRCSTRAIAMLAAMRRPYTLDYYRRARRRDRRAPAARLDRLRHDRRVSRRDRRRLRRELSTYLPALAADAPPRVSRIPIGRAPRRRRCATRSTAPSSASAARALREIGAALTRAVPRSRRSAPSARR